MCVLWRLFLLNRMAEVWIYDFYRQFLRKCLYDSTSYGGWKTNEFQEDLS